MYKDMTKILKDSTVGEFSLEHFTIPKDDLYALYHNIPSGDYVKLTHNGSLLMSNTLMEKETNKNFVIKAHGNVLIGGLGIGMIILAIQDKLTVKKITVIEKIQK